MTEHTVGTREEWLVARLELLASEKELTRRNDELTRQRQQLPWVRIDKDYKFETTDGPASLRDLFGERSQLLVHHMMFPGCPSCASSARTSPTAAACCPSRAAHTGSCRSPTKASMSPRS